jgi:plasmid stabilization system protein ParE
MTPVVWSRLAKSDLERFVTDALTHDNFEDARRLKEAADRMTAFLSDHPATGREIGGGRRKYGFGKLPFLLIYRLRRDDVAILRVVHRYSDWTNLA